MTLKTAASLLLSALSLFALPITGAPPGNTGAPGHNTCNQCHTSFPLNPPGGSVRIDAASYKPSQAQTVKVTVSHPEAQRWGFQIRRAMGQEPNPNGGPI